MIITDREENQIVKHTQIHDKNAFDLLQKHGLSLNNLFKVEIKEYPKCEDCGDVLHRQQITIKKKKYCMRCSFRYTANGKVRKEYQKLENRVNKT